MTNFNLERSNVFKILEKVCFMNTRSVTESENSKSFSKKYFKIQILLVRGFQMRILEPNLMHFNPKFAIIFVACSTPQACREAVGRRREASGGAISMKN